MILRKLKGEAITRIGAWKEGSMMMMMMRFETLLGVLFISYTTT